MKTITISKQSAIMGAVTFFTMNEENFSIYDLTTFLRRSVNSYIYYIDEYDTDNFDTDDNEGVQYIPHEDVSKTFTEMLSNDTINWIKYKGINSYKGVSYREYGIIDDIDELNNVLTKNILNDIIDDDDDDDSIASLLAGLDDTDTISDSLDGKKVAIVSTGSLADIIDNTANTRLRTNVADIPSKVEAIDKKDKFKLSHSGTTVTQTVLSRELTRKIRQYLGNRSRRGMPPATFKQIQSSVKVSGITCEDMYESFKGNNDYFIDTSSNRVSTYTIKLTPQWKLSA